MAPPLKKCDPNVRCCVPELSSGPFAKPTHQSPFIQNPLDSYTLDTPTIFDPDFKWSEQPKRLGDMSTADLQQMAWEHHLRKANQDPVILKQRELAKQFFKFTDGKVAGEIYALDLHGKDLPPSVMQNIPPKLAANPQNAAYTMAWDGDNAVIHFFEIPDNGSVIRVMQNPGDGNLYIVEEPNNVQGAIACWDVKSPVVSASENDESSSLWPFNLSTEDALFGGSIFMLGTTTQGSLAARETPASGGSFNTRMSSAALGTALFVGLAYGTHKLGIPQDVAPYVEVGAGLGIFYGADKLFAYAKMPINMPWGSMLRASPYMYVGSLGAAYAWKAAGLKPGSFEHTAATITTSMVGYQFVKYGIGRLPATSALSEAMAASANPAAKIATMSLRTRMLVGGLRAVRIVGIIGLIDWAVSGAMTIYDHLSGDVKNPNYKLDEALIAEQMDRVCEPGNCNWLGKAGNWIMPKIGIFSTGLRKLAHRGFNKLGIRTSFDDRIENRITGMSMYANDWAQAIDDNLLSIALGVMLSANADPKQVVSMHRGKGALESIDMIAVEAALKEFFSLKDVKKYTSNAREIISDLKDTRHKDWLSPSAVTLWNALASNGKIDDKNALRKHIMKLLSTTALRQSAFLPEHRPILMTVGKPAPKKPVKGLFTKRVERELAKMRLAYFEARKKIGLADGTVPSKLTKAQEDFLFGGRETTLVIEQQKITVSKLMSPEIYFRKRIDALEHVLSVLKASAKDKDSSPDLAWHFQKAN